MPQPQIKGYKIDSLVGEGACGSIYIARKSTKPKLGEWFAVRSFDSLAVNRPLLESITSRLNQSNYPDGLAPITWVQPKRGSDCIIMPMLADVDEAKSTIKIRSLQERITEYPKGDAWDIIDKMAHALASMHERRIPHGNLKPGNIFFDDKGELLLTDFAMGHMPDVSMLPYTDAILYAPPEQLRDPAGYHSEKGYGWDTYAFAAISFRLLTGKFSRCDNNFQKIVQEAEQGSITSSKDYVIKLAEQLENSDLEDGPEKKLSPREIKRLKVLKRCLSINPDERYHNLPTVIQAWKDIDTQTRVAKDRSKLKKKIALCAVGMVTALLLAAAGAKRCLVVSELLKSEKSARSSDVNELNTYIQTLTQERKNAQESESAAITRRDQAVTREVKIRDQLIALGVTNDHLLAWMLRDKNADLPELRKTGPDKTAVEAMKRELRNFLKITEGEEHFQDIRARILLQLSELEVHQGNPSTSSGLLDKAIPALKKANVTEPDLNYRIARARLIGLMQAQDQKNQELVIAQLPKAREAIAQLKSSDPTETQRIHATMEIIDGRLIEDQNPTKAISHFQNAIENLKGIQKALPENIGIRSDLAKRILHCSTLAESLDRIDDATKLRGEAANHLRWLLAKNPKITFARIRLAEIEIISAEADLLSGLDSAGQRKLEKAEELLNGLDTTDITPTGAAMQIALTKGLRSVLLRDIGQTSNSAKSLDSAIGICKRIVAANPDAHEPLYRLAGFHWQRASLAGSTGDYTTELKLGKSAADMMEQVLKKGAGKHDNELRRSLAYLYGNLAKTSSRKKRNSDALAYYKNAATIWQSLVDKDSKSSEYTEGLKWSQQRAKSLSQ